MGEQKGTEELYDTSETSAEDISDAPGHLLYGPCEFSGTQ